MTLQMDYTHKCDNGTANNYHNKPIFNYKHKSNSQSVTS